VICLVFSEPAAEWALEEASLAALVILSLLTAPVGLINALCAQALRNRFQTRQFVFWNVTAAVLSIGLSFGSVIVLGWGVAGILVGALVAALIVLPFRLWTIRDLLQPQSIDRRRQWAQGRQVALPGSYRACDVHTVRRVAV
jgi:O-antigen/teichoic acid export membrane protein